MKTWFQVALLAVGLSSATALAEPDTYYGVAEEPAVDFALEPNKAYVLSPADKSTVSNDGGPRIEICVTNASGGCSSGPYNYEVFINGVMFPSGTSSTSPWLYAPSPVLGDGTYEVYVRATALPTGTGTPPSYTSSTISFTVDATAPGIDIGDPKPPPVTLDTNATFSFSSTDMEARFECALDSPGTGKDPVFSDCDSPKRYNGLGFGIYTFFVKAIDLVGNESAPATYTWEVVPLDTTIILAPPSSTSSTTATFTFSGGARYECELDAPGTDKDQPFATCTSPKHYSGLGDGTYIFSVRAIDAWGRVDSSPATRTWTVDTVPPGDMVITSAPAVNTNLTNATFEFSAVDAVSYECALGAPETSGEPPFSSCASPKSYTRLGNGIYSFFVRAVDAAQNRGNATRYDWNIDTTPPVTRVLLPADGDMVSTPTPTIVGTVDDPLSTVQVFMDGALIGAVTANMEGQWSLLTSTGLSNGFHSVSAKATNPAGLLGSPSASNVFTVDTVPPETEIISAPPKSSNSRLAAFEFGSPSGATDFDCRLDDARSFAACGPTPVFTKLSDGEHTLQVRARDSAGNVDPSPAIYQWTVIIRPPPSPDVVEPADGATVSTGTPAISGKAVPKSTVTIYIDGRKSGVALADESGNWTFRPPVPLEVGEHRLTTEATDEAGNTSERHSDERVFTILVGQAQSIGGGLSCASSGAQPASAGLFLAMGLWLTRFRRRFVVTQELRGNRSRMSGF
ncbi:MAG TPA: Ig-like domain-containing protein [Archangium sp.]|uniref:Ig-like domain-containing protein n=1 Tax=Archangium sp. TaxID=1872627 RepID=UPI002E374515|nr:Ig-like domain-containing protein [Archangium sp.]HEX5750978.1 Ig-like domain-containing protein [Archangium sp.]